MNATKTEIIIHGVRELPEYEAGRKNVVVKDDENPTGGFTVYERSMVNGQETALEDAATLKEAIEKARKYEFTSKEVIIPGVLFKHL